VTIDLAALADRVAGDGLRLRGGFNPGPDDGVPVLPGGTAPGTVILVGNIGSSLWASFSASPEARDGQPDPLDRWTRRAVDRVAAEIGAGGSIPLLARGTIIVTTGSPPTARVWAASACQIDGLVRSSTTITTVSPAFTAM